MLAVRKEFGSVSLQIMLLFAGLSVLCAAVVSLTTRTASFNALNTRYAGLYNLAVSCVNAQLGKDNADLNALYADMTIDDEPPTDSSFKNAAEMWLASQTRNFTIAHDSFTVSISISYARYIVDGIALTLTAVNTNENDATVVLFAKTIWDGHNLKLSSLARQSG
ncbi:MAG: hypothetical protein LBL96_09250 [Clostridiales bacterium]|jgi:hypothetical protein|nr:hypothetical protein [Clostridiales bacterium]